jgi:hypothetical protein
MRQQPPRPLRSSPVAPAAPYGSLRLCCCCLETETEAQEAAPAARRAPAPGRRTQVPAEVDPAVPTEGEGEEVSNRTPVVKNVTVAQVEGTKVMAISYDLHVSDGHPCVVTVKWSTDNGETYPLTATALVGEAGPGIDPGDGLAITWDMSKDWDNKFTQAGRIKIIASRIPHDYVPGGGSETGGHSETGK